MILEMNQKDFTEMIQNSEKFKISSFTTDYSLERIRILANSYIYEFDDPNFKVISNKDPVKLREKIIKTINTKEIMGHRLISVIEERQNIDLSSLRVDE
jgi:hypothetical protein